MSRHSPEPSSADLAKWGRLVRAACACAAAADEGRPCPAGDLAQAARAARRAQLVGAVERSNPFFRLQRAAVAFAEASERARRAQAGALGDLARACGEALAARAARAAQPAPTRRYRADIDG